MSSILKALKKIEQSGSAADPGSEAAPSAPHTLLPLRAPGKRIIRRNLAYALAAGLALVAAAGVYTWWVPATAPPAAGGDPRAIRAKLPAGTAERNTRPAAPPVKPDPFAAPSVPPPPVSEPPAVAMQPPSQSLPRPDPPLQAPPPSTRLRPRETTGASPPESRPALPQRPAPRPPAERPAAARPAPARTAEDALGRVDDSKLKVMAIAWSDNPARRLAVVNGYIVKEGESVDGYSVTQIRKDDIIVSDGSRSWRVELNIKTQP